jgi:glutathione S-transferase
VEAARAQVRKSYGMIDHDMATRGDGRGSPWPIAPRRHHCPSPTSSCHCDGHPNLARYFERLSQRPSIARTFKEAEPFLKYFPG